MRKKTIMSCIAIILIVAGVILAIVNACIPGPEVSKIGKVFVHINPGRSDDPDKPSDPWVGIYTVLEVRDGKARLKWRTLRLGGGVREYEIWEDTKRVGKFDEEIEVTK